MAISIGDALLKVGIDTKQAEAQLNRFSKKMGGAGKSLQKISTPALVAGGAIAAGLGLAVKQAADFHQSLTNAVSVTGLSGDAAKEAKKQMSALAQQLGLKTKFSAKQAADAMYDLASSGWKTADMAKGLPGIMNLAAATQADLTSTTETVTATLKQFGMQAGSSGRVADVFTKAIGSSKATIEKLAVSMNYVGPVAHSVGLSLEDTTAILGGLYNAGYDGSMAGTALRAAMSRLLKPTAHAAAAIKNMGLSADQVNPSMNNMKDILMLLHDKGMTATQAMTIFGVQAGPAMLTLTKEGIEGVNKLSTSLEKSGGAAKGVADQQLNTLNGQLTILKGSLQGLAITFGEQLTPAITPIIEHLTTLVNRFAALPAPIKKVIMITTLFTGSGLLAAGAVGKISKSVQEFMPVLSNMFGFIRTTAIPRLMAFQASIGPIGWAIEGLIAVVALLVVAWKKDWGGIQEKTRAVWKKLQYFFHRIGAGLQWIIKVVRSVIGWFERLFDKIVAVINKLNVFHRSTAPTQEATDAANEIGSGIPGYASGGMINEPTLLYGLRSMKPYAIAGEAGPERVGPVSQSKITNNFNISELVVREEADVKRIAKELYRMQRNKEVLVGT